MCLRYTNMSSLQKRYTNMSSSTHCHYSNLNPLASEYHPYTFTTTPSLNNPFLHRYQPPPRLFIHRNLFNFPTYYYLTVPTSPSSQPPALNNQTQDDQTHLETTARTRGGTNLHRRGGRRCVRQQRRRAPATVSTVEGNGGRRNSGAGRERRRISEGRRRVGGSNSGRECNKGEVMELERDAAYTTVMIRNIPSRYTRELLMNFLDNHCKAMNTGAFNSEFTSAYDFVYLPVDFHTNANKGFAFVNFTDPRAAWRFYETSNNQLWDLFRSSKMRQIVRAKLQGKENLVKHFRGSTFRCKSDDYLPAYLRPPRDGCGEQKVEIKTVGLRVW